MYQSTSVVRQEVSTRCLGTLATTHPGCLCVRGLCTLLQAGRHLWWLPVVGPLQLMTALMQWLWSSQTQPQGPPHALNATSKAPSTASSSPTSGASGSRQKLRQQLGSSRPRLRLLHLQQCWWAAVLANDMMMCDPSMCDPRICCAGCIRNDHDTDGSLPVCI